MSAFKLQKSFSKEHESSVFSISHKKELEEKQKSDEIIYLKPFLKLGYGAVPFSLLKKLKDFDLIYFHYPFFGTAFIIYLFKLLHPKKKVIIHYHMDVKHKNILFKILSWPEELIKNSLFKKSDSVVSASLDYIKNSQIKNIYLRYQNKFKEIPFAINTEEFKANIESKENILLFVGGLDKAHYFKGVEILIQAFSKIENKEYRLKIIGEGNQKDKFIKLCQKLEIEKRVEFLGKLDKEELIQNYQRAKITILPSINSNEAFGIVLIESLACATPVIASNLPGVRSVFEDGKSGLTVETNNVLDLKEKIEILINNPAKLADMEIEARKLAENKYSQIKFEQNLQELLNL
jgi:glycosyltransferase involved in cell wall biosynthesis